MAAAVSDEVKERIKLQKQNSAARLRTYNNILAMTQGKMIFFSCFQNAFACQLDLTLYDFFPIQPLHAKSPSFIGDKRINLSWKEATKPTPSAATGAGAKRPGSTVNGASHNAAKKGRGAGGLSNQLVNRAFKGISYGGRGGGRGRG
ncbi:hypothetical protein Ancab_005377 [Ancistrocladus abbreviatus]